MFYKILNFLEPGLHDVIYFDIMEELLIKQRPLLYIGVWRKKASDDHYETIHLHPDINKTTENKMTHICIELIEQCWFIVNY